MALCPIQAYEKEESRVSEELVTEIGGGIETGQSYSSNIRTPRTVTKGSPSTASSALSCRGCSSCRRTVIWLTPASLTARVRIPIIYRNIS